MRGYRCDNCLDFAAEVMREQPSSGFYGLYSRSGPPPQWLVLSAPESEVALHFCSPGCLNAFNEKHLEVWTG